MPARTIAELGVASRHTPATIGRRRSGSRRLAVVGAVSIAVFVAAARGAAAQMPSPRSVALDVVGQLEPYEEVGGDALAVDAGPGTAFLGVGRWLYVLDVSDTASPRLLGRTPALPESIRALEAQGDRVYIAAGAGGLQVADVADRAAPRVVGALALGAPAVDVAVGADRAYVTAGNALDVVDTSDPDAPSLLGTVALRGPATALAVEGDRAFVATGPDAVAVVDVSDPARPVEIASTLVTGQPLAVALGPGALYVGDAGGAVSIYQRSSSGDLSRVGRAAVGSQPRAIAVINAIVVVADNAGRLVTVNVSNPARPAVDTVKTTAGRPLDVALADNHAFVANGSQGLWIVPLTSRGSQGAFRTWIEAGIAVEGLGIAARGSIVYYGNGGSGLVIVDAAEPDRPRVVRRMTTQGYIEALAADDRRLVVAAQESGLQVYDIAADPALPTLLAQVADPLAASGVALDDGRAFVTEGIGGLWIVDVSRAQPQVLGHRELPGYAAGVAVAGDLAYVAAGTAGVHVVDISDPRRPDLVTTVDTPGMAMDVAVEGDVAVVAEGSRGVRVFDLGEPLRPRDVAFVAVRGDVWDATLADGLAFVTANAGGLRVIDVADPAQPRTAGRLVQPYPYRSVALGAPGYAYLAGTGPGMSVVRYTVGVSPTGTTGPQVPTATATPRSGGTPTSTVSVTPAGSETAVPSAPPTPPRPTAIPTGAPATRRTCHLPLLSR